MAFLRTEKSSMNENDKVLSEQDQSRGAEIPGPDIIYKLKVFLTLSKTYREQPNNIKSEYITISVHLSKNIMA